MKNNKLRFVGIGISILVCGVVLYLIAPVAIDIYTSLRNYNQRIASQSDYTKITTPLPKNTVSDICSKFELDVNDDRCLPGSVVYGPDFFDDIKAYLNNLPDEKATFDVVHDKLGLYLVFCESPNNEGHYACRYDLRGDGIYPILIFFTKDGYYYRIIANTSGS